MGIQAKSAWDKRQSREGRQDRVGLAGGYLECQVEKAGLGGVGTRAQ